MSAPVPANESERLAALRRYRVLDTLPERDFDDLTFLAARICGTPIALVTLVDADRQWFKAKVGIDAKETSREVAFCSHAILQSDLLIVPDACADVRFSTNPLVTGPPHIRFYAGAPLITSDGHALGTLCVIDLMPHELTAEQAHALRALSRQVVTQLELRKARTDLESALQKIEERWRAVFDKSPHWCRLNRRERPLSGGELRLRENAGLHRGGATEALVLRRHSRGVPPTQSGTCYGDVDRKSPAV
jgi:GAF domain-containing protein